MAHTTPNHSSSSSSQSTPIMDSKHGPSALPFIFFFILFSSFGSSDISKDRAKCGNVLVGIATCLPYVSEGDTVAKVPSVECCSGLNQVLQTNKECLCLLIKDRNDPSLGFKINATLALGLPDKCHVPTNISECIDLLHLPPNSPDAKIFQELPSSSKGSNTTSAPAPDEENVSSNNVTNDGSGGKRGLRKEVFWGLLITVLLHCLSWISCWIN